MNFHPDVQERLTKYIRQTRADIALMKGKTVQPSAVEVAEVICADLEKIAAGLSTAISATGPSPSSTDGGKNGG